MRTIEKSLSLYRKAKRLIPGGAQTASKMYGRFVQGVAPPFLSKCRGSHVWDLDGNEYIDWTASLGPVILGYGVVRVGGEYSQSPSRPLPHRVEVELAEKLVDIIPCAEMVRFFTPIPRQRPFWVTLNRNFSSGQSGNLLSPNIAKVSAIPTKKCWTGIISDSLFNLKLRTSRGSGIGLSRTFQCCGGMVFPRSSKR